MAAKNHSWTIGDTGCGNGPAGENDHLPGGQIDVPFGPTTTGDGFTSHMSERSNVPYEYDFGKQIDFSGAPDRVDVPAGLESYGIPDPGAGISGQPIDFNAVAPDTDRGVSHDLEGDGAPAASRSSAAAPGAPV